MADNELEARRERLSAQKKAVLERIKQKHSVEQKSGPLIPPRPPAASAALSFAQQRIWFMHQLDPQAATYNLPVSMRLRGALRIDILEHCLAEITLRHEILRTTFSLEEDQPRQHIHPDSSIDLRQIDLRELPAEERQPAARRQLGKFFQQPFDLESGPLWRTCVFCLGKEEYILATCLHHIIADGWSLEILSQEISQLYTALSRQKPAALVPLSIQYADYACWQWTSLQEARLQEQLMYWREQLKDAPRLLSLPTDHARPLFQSSRGASCSALFPLPLLLNLRQASSRHGATLFMTLLAAFQVILMRYSGQEDILVGTPVANRFYPELEPLIGCFLNILVLRTRLDGNPSFLSLLANVRNTCLNAYANQDIPFESVVDALAPTRDISYHPLFQALFVLHNTPTERLTLSEIVSEAFEVETGTTIFDITLNMVETEKGLFSTFEYNTDLFAQTTIERMQRHFQTLLESIAAEMARPIAFLPLLSSGEREEIVHAWNATRVDYPLEESVPLLFAAQAARTPDALALISAGEEITYGALQQSVNRLANSLLARGLTRETPVGIYLEQSIETVICLLAVLSAGGMYLPLDPRYPRERLIFMLEDSQTRLVITRRDSQAQLEGFSGEVIYLDQEQEHLASLPGSSPPVFLLPDQLAYCIYTSGSTGKPKGVQISHRALSNFLFAMRDLLHLGPRDQLLSVTTFSFDIAGLELYLPLLSGASVLLATQEEALDGNLLAHLLQTHPVTCMQATPATWRMLLAADWPGKAGLTILCGAEALPLDLLCQLAIRGASCWNLYGPTETTIWSVVEPFTLETKQVLIGRPLANTRVYVLDAWGQPVPPGVTGELYIGGLGLARGYRKQPALTAEYFLPDPFSGEAGARLYRTGDLVRFTPTGKLEYIQRRDTQVKVRGFRIELAEIEHAIRQHRHIQDVAVLINEDETGNKRLIACLVLANSHSLSEIELHDFLRQKLPFYAIPERYLFLSALPLTASGKIDRRVLAQTHLPEQQTPDPAQEVASLTMVEELIAGMFRELLEKPVDAGSNFFEVGGNSLQAAQLAARIKKTLQVELPMRHFFEAPTIAACSRFVESRLRARKFLDQPPLLPVARTGQAYPLSFAQQRLWFLDQLYPASLAYIMPLAFRVRGPLLEEVLQRSLQEIIRRHDILRTSFALQNGEPVQVIAPSSPFTLLKEDLRAIAEPERLKVAVQQVSSACRIPFDLARGPLFRARLWQLESQDFIFLFNVHHSVFDGWSMGIFGQELATFYRAFAQDQPSPLPDLPLQYVDYALWQRAWLQGEVLERLVHNWRQQLADLPPLQLARRKSVESEGDMGRQLPFAFSVELSAQLRHTVRQEGTTTFMLMFALFALLLHDFTVQNDFAIGTDFANRGHVETENLLGFFVNQLLLRVHVDRAQTFQHFLADVRETTLEAYAHQDLPFDKLVEIMQPERTYGRNPLLQAKFVLQNTPVSPLALDELDIDLLDLPIETAKFDLLCNMVEDEQGIQGYWEYRVNVLEDAEATALCLQYTALAEIVCAQPDLPLRDIFRLEAERRTDQQVRRLQEIRETGSQKIQQVKRRTIIARKEDKHDG